MSGSRKPAPDFSRGPRVSNTATQHYGRLSKTLHWSIALLIIGLILLGWYMVGLTYYDRWSNESLELHKSLGMLVLALACANIVWNHATARPALPPGMHAWERIAAKSAHGLLYLMMLLIPITGYIISTSAGKAVSVFGILDIPAVLPQSEQLRDIAIELHYYMAYGTAVLVCLHALAAFKHQFIDKDGTLRRML